MGQFAMGVEKFLCCWHPLATPGGIGEGTGKYFCDMPQALGLTSAWKLFNTGATISLISCKRDQRRVHRGAKWDTPMAPVCSSLLSPKSVFPKRVPWDLHSMRFHNGSSYIHLQTDTNTHHSAKPDPTRTHQAQHQVSSLQDFLEPFT